MRDHYEDASVNTQESHQSDSKVTVGVKLKERGPQLIVMPMNSEDMERLYSIMTKRGHFSVGQTFSAWLKEEGDKNAGVRV